MWPHLLTVASVILLSTLGVQAAAALIDSCTALPSWTVENFTSHTNDTVGSGGNASLVLTNNLTGTRDEVTCRLQVNYRCIVVGTPSDKNLTVHIAIRAGFVTLLLDSEVLDCPGRTAPLHVIGRDDVELKCTWDEAEVVGGSLTCSQAREADVLQGEVVELAPT